MRSLSLFEKLKKVYRRHSQTTASPSLVECSRLLQAAANEFLDIFVIIDALDECAQATRETVFDQIRKLLPEARILVTSRHSFGAQFDVNASHHLEVQANETDIECYLRDRIRDCRALQVHINKHAHLHDRIISDVISKTNGM